MATKCITITTDAYDKLAALKGHKESFSDVVMRITKPRGSLLDLSGVISKERVDALERAIQENRKRVDEDVKRKL